MARLTLNELRQCVRDSDEAWRKISGRHGPCGPTAMAVRRLGYAPQVWFALTSEEGKDYFNHWLNKLADGTIFDVSGVYLDTHRNDIVPLYKDWKGPCRWAFGYSHADVDFWVARFRQAERKKGHIE